MDFKLPKSQSLPKINNEELIKITTINEEIKIQFPLEFNGPKAFLPLFFPEQ